MTSTNNLGQLGDVSCRHNGCSSKLTIVEYSKNGCDGCMASYMLTKKIYSFKIVKIINDHSSFMSHGCAYVWFVKPSGRT